MLVGGLPGTGKSTLAVTLADRAGFEVIRSDAVRKEPGQAGRGRPYTPGWDDRTYAECLRRAERLLFEGRRVLIDATWREQRRRRAFLGAAARWGVPGGLLICQATPETVRRRLAARRGDVSDADWAVYQELVKGWEGVEGLSPGHVHTVPSDGDPGQVADHAAGALRELGLLG
ncbi:MAG: AAA family ATPase [Gemmataceae bacterium]